MNLSDFDYDLPEDRIALRPVSPRRAARMLVSAPGAALCDSRAEALPEHLKPGDVLVLNDTRVIPARLSGLRRRPDGAEARIEATLIAREGPDRWRALARPGKRLRVGDVVAFGALRAEIGEKGEGGETLLIFDKSGADLDAAIAEAGVAPLPPYIAARRPADAADASDYQTVFARRDGAVAAPTASLHFDSVLLAALKARGVRFTHVTLHVGAGTFLPVKAERIEDHRMHAEWGEITPEAVAEIETARAAGGRVVAAGTTALRLLESAARQTGRLAPWRGETDLFVAPGFEFRVTDGLMTNFHLPRSTLLMLVGAFVGMDRLREIYAHAVRDGYRFYSYGDASLLFR